MSTTEVDVTEFDAHLELPPERRIYTFGGAPPVGSLRPRAMLSTSTWDCFGGRLTRMEDRATEVCDPRYINPQTGPFYVDGARPGDTLAVHFVSIRPRDARGVSATIPHFGALTGTRLTSLLHPPLPELTWIYHIDLSEGVTRFVTQDGKLSHALPLDPMHGTVGVAPDLREVRSSLDAGPWGGNMDSPEVRAGSTCYLRVNVDGALLSIGDGHARQGEGETCGVAVECSMYTDILVDVLKDVEIAWPRIETDSHIMTVGSGRPLEDAFRTSHVEMVKWVSELLGMASMDAYQLVSQIAETPLANVCDTAYSVVCKVRKGLLPPVHPMNGLHEELRETARRLVVTPS